MSKNPESLQIRHDKAIEKMKAKIFTGRDLSDYRISEVAVIPCSDNIVFEGLGGLSFRLKNPKGIEFKIDVSHREGKFFNFFILDLTHGYTMRAMDVAFDDLPEALMSASALCWQQEPMKPFSFKKDK